MDLLFKNQRPFSRLLMAASGAAIVSFSCQDTLSNHAALPDPDFFGSEKQVVEKIGKLRGEVENNSYSGLAWGKLAMNLDVHDFKREAIPCYEQAIVLDSTDFRWPYYYAILLNGIGAGDAIKWFGYCRNLRPAYIPLLIRFGNALSNSGKITESGTLFAQALALDSTSVHATIGLARNALQRGKLDKCRQYLLTVAEIDSSSREVYGLLAEVTRRLGKYVESEKALLRARKLPMVTEMRDSLYDAFVAEGESAYWYRMRGEQLLELGKFEKAAQQFKKALARKPSPGGHFFIGGLSEKTENYAEASEQYVTAIRLDPSYVEAYVSLGKALHKLGRVQEAIRWTQKGLRINPRIPDLYENLANFHLAAGRTQPAIAAYNRGLDFTGGNIFLATRLGWLLATGADEKFRDGKEAVRILERVCRQINYQTPEPIDALAAAYAESGDLRRAIELAEKAHKLAKLLGGRDLAELILKRLTLYKSGKPYWREITDQDE